MRYNGLIEHIEGGRSAYLGNLATSFRSPFTKCFVYALELQHEQLLRHTDER
jgi:hypothetical protein